MLCVPSSPLFIWSFGPPQIVASIVDHELIGSATHREQIPFTQSILEHLLIGVCAGNHGSGCFKLKTACHQTNVRPSVFALQCLSAPHELELPTDARLPDLRSAFGLSQGALPSTVGSAISAHMLSLSHVPFNGEDHYLARYFDDFDNAGAGRLTRLCVAHGLQGIASMSSENKRVILLAHMLGAGCVHNIVRPMLSMPAGCLEVISEI